MQSAVVLAERFMSQYEDRLPLSLICDEILAVLADGGVRIGDPVPEDLAERGAAAAGAGGHRSDPAAGDRQRVRRRTAVITPEG